MLSKDIQARLFEIIAELRKICCRQLGYETATGWDDLLLRRSTAPRPEDLSLEGDTHTQALYKELKRNAPMQYAS